MQAYRTDLLPYPFNRTIRELKLFAPTLNKQQYISFNRTIRELKQPVRPVCCMMNDLLIEPLGN